MIRFDMIICLKAEGYKRQNFIKRFMVFIKDIFIRPDASKWVDEICFENGLNIGVIRIPYDIDKIKSFGKRRRESLVNSIHELSITRDTGSCIIPKALLELEFNDIVFKKFFSGRFIFKSALVDILSKISIINKKRMDDFDVVIINGSNNSELLRFVNTIALNLKYLTIVFKDDNHLENELESIFEATGTAISSTNDLKRTISNSDIIINLDDDFELPKQKLKPETVIINYSDKGMSTENCHRVLINNIKLKLPNQLRHTFEKDILWFFSEVQMCEIIIGHMINCVDNIENNLHSEFLDKEISRIMRQEGFEIIIT